MSDSMHGHAQAELRSLIYHQHIAQKILRDPAIVARALERLQHCHTHPTYREGWRQLLEGPRDELLAFLSADTEVARAHRQASPFTSALTARERWALWKALRPDTLRPDTLRPDTLRPDTLRREPGQ